MAIALKPLLNINEHDIVPFYSFSGSIPQTKGVFVTVQGSGWNNSINPVIAGPSTTAGWYGEVNQPNSLAPIYIVPSRVALSQPGDKPLGVLFYDVKEFGFLNYPLRFDPVRRAEAQCALSGEAVQVVRAGLFLVSGINYSYVTGTGNGTGLATLANGTNSGVKADVNGGWIVTTATDPLAVGQILGSKDNQGFTLVDVDCR